MNISRLNPSLVPNLPNLLLKDGKREALQIGRLPNLPSLPNVFSRMRMCTRARLCVCETTNIGWEGWEGWEEQAAERVSSSQPKNEGWEGWEKAGKASGENK